MTPQNGVTTNCALLPCTLETSMNMKSFAALFVTIACSFKAVEPIDKYLADYRFLKPIGCDHNFSIFGSMASFFS